MSKNRILIADDAELNREMLTLMLGDRYDFVYAQDGLEAIDILRTDDAIDLVLLDVNMPNMGGFEVLQVMNDQKWIEDIPVIIISAEDNADFIAKGFSLGVTDYISRPFHSVVVERRVENTLMMHSKQKSLVRLVERQVLEREKINNALINIFSDIIELRNQESGSHTLHVQSITHLLLNRLVAVAGDRYPLTRADVSMISSLAALHDIGKITIPESILNKPGKLTAEEWVIMKTHTTAGDEILSRKELDQNSKFVRTARNICRWHHEKYDGRGYPDGLSGDNIPIEAQVVSLADVYDALTSERAYKRAFPHDQAVRMILNGECGAFNPILLQCFQDSCEELRTLVQTEHLYDFRSSAMEVADELLSEGNLPQENMLHKLLEDEHRKKRFFMECAEGIQFEYDKLLNKVTYIHHFCDTSALRGTEHTDRDSEENMLPVHYWDELRDLLVQSGPEHPVVESEVTLLQDGEEVPYHAYVMALWPEKGGSYTQVVGHFIRKK